MFNTFSIHQPPDRFRFINCTPTPAAEGMFNAHSRSLHAAPPVAMNCSRDNASTAQSQDGGHGMDLSRLAGLLAGREAQLTDPAERVSPSQTSLSSVSNPNSFDVEITARAVVYEVDIPNHELPHGRLVHNASEMPPCLDGEHQMQAGVDDSGSPEAESSEWWLEDARNDALDRVSSCHVPQASVESPIDQNSHIARSSTPPSDGIQHFQSMTELSPHPPPTATSSSASLRSLHSAHGAQTTPGCYEFEAEDEDDDEEDDPPRRPFRRRKHTPTTSGDITHTDGVSVAQGRNSCGIISQQEEFSRRNVTRSPSTSPDVSDNGMRLRESEAAQPNRRTTRVFQRPVRAKRGEQCLTVPNEKATLPMHTPISPAPRRQRGRPRRSRSLAFNKSRSTKSKPKSEKHPQYHIKAIVGTEVHKGIEYAVVSWEDTLEPLNVIKAEAPLAWEEFCI